MKHATTMIRLTAVAALVVAVFAAGTSMRNGGVGPLPEAHAEATEDATVRISAKRLDNGRTEFGLQVRTNGEWGPEGRLLPRIRMFPANVEVGRWLRSSPLELDSGHVVRITAQLLENGRIEFGLHNVVDGDLGERLLPRSRMFPVNPTVDRWLNSSLLVLSVQTPAQEPIPEEQSGATEPPPEEQSGRTEAGATYRIDYPAFLNGEQRSWVSVKQRSDATGPDGPLSELRVLCQQGARYLQIVDLPQTAEGEHTVQSRVDEGEWSEATWDVLTGDVLTGDSVVFTSPPLDYERLRSGSVLEIEMPLDPVFRATFDLAALFDTPAQTSIDDCGAPARP